MMNGLEQDTEKLLDKLSREKCLQLVPVHMYVTIMMVTGLIGNVLVCRFYTTRGRATPTTRLILAVAVIDTIVCVLMPKNIATMCLSYKSYGDVPCKLNVYLNHVTGGSSLVVLVAIAVFRFRAVCRPFSSQFTLRHTNIAILSLVLMSLILSTPILFTHESTAIVVKVSANGTATGYNCQSSENSSHKPLIWAFNGLFVILFAVCLVTLFLTYSLIGLKILKQYRMRKGLSSKPTRETSNETTDSSENITDTTNGFSDATKEESASNSKETIISEESFVGRRGVDIRSTSFCADNDFELGATEKRIGDTESGLNTTVSKVSSTQSADTVDKTTNHTIVTGHMNDAFNTSATAIRQVLMLFVITLIFVVSCLPYLAISISSAVSDNTDEDKYTNWYQFCFKSYLINSASNPFVYGFFNTEFRHYIKCLIRRCICFHR